VNREYDPLTKRARVASAAVAVIATAGVILSILGLAGHYDKQYLRAAEAQSATTVNHAQAPAAAHDNKTNHG
jgi:hypothetical protein